MTGSSRRPLPPGQQLAAPAKWPTVGEPPPSRLPDPWRVSLVGEVTYPCQWTIDQLRELPQTARSIDLHCVTRWSKLDVWLAGVPLAALLAEAGPTDQARFVSFVACSERGHSSSLPLADAVALDTLIALSWDGAPLPLCNGGPVRVIVPGRYLYKSVKWLERIELLAEDRLGYWEAEAGYHNGADPWQEQRFVASRLSRRDTATLIRSRDFAGRDLAGAAMAGLDLCDLNARGATLRNVDFRNCRLQQARFDGARLANARFAGADLRGACFWQADIEGADFTGADLRGADLRVASLLGVSFWDTEDADQPAAWKRGARLDSQVQLDPAQFHTLSPDQEAYVRRQLAPDSD